MSDPIEDAITAHHSIQDREYDDYVAVRDRLYAFYEADQVEPWLRAAHPQLDGQSALSMIVKGEAHKVHEIIDRLESSVYL